MLTLSHRLHLHLHLHLHLRHHTHQRLSGLLDGRHGTLALAERGDVEAVKRHPDFRLLAAMNPATDVGKKDLPPALRSLFTELYVDEMLATSDLQIVASSYLQDMPKASVATAVGAYLDARGQADTNLQDGGGCKPHYSLRTLCRSLEGARFFLNQGYALERAMFEGFAMNFATQLCPESRSLMHAMLAKSVGRTTKPGSGKTKALDVKALQNAKPCPRPGGKDYKTKLRVHDLMDIEGFWLRAGSVCVCVWVLVETIPFDPPLPCPRYSFQRCLWRSSCS
jgi:midasin